jgi:hypothetical protein
LLAIALPKKDTDRPKHHFNQKAIATLKKNNDRLQHYPNQKAIATPQKNNNCPNIISIKKHFLHT